MSKIVIVSDTHFGHKFLAKRKAQTVDEFNEEIIKVWNHVIDEDDIVIHLGDVTFMGKKKTQEIFERLNGNKLLIPGNHDRGRLKNPDMRHWFNEIGFNNVEVGTEYIEIEHQGNKIVLSHEPVSSEVLANNDLNIHGHIHDGVSKTLYEMHSKRFNACEKIISLDDIMELAL